MNNDNLILIVDDEVAIRRLLRITLTANNYKVIEAGSRKECMAMLAMYQPALIILDLGLPDADGIDILNDLREWYQKAIIILSARDSEKDIIHALDLKANDYLTKPFRSGELLARIRAAIRQAISTQEQERSSIEIEDLTIDLMSHTVKKNGELLKLTSTEFSLLGLFAKNQGCVLTHQYILKEIWGSNYIDQTQSLRVFVAQLRKKIENNPSQPVLLITESGIGYRFGI